MSNTKGAKSDDKALTNNSKKPQEKNLDLSEEEIAKEIKPLSTNSFLAFFQNIWRKWLSTWYAFSDKYPNFSKLVYTVAMFVIFSMGVTIIQYLGFTFLPMLFGIELAGTEFMWPKIPLYSIDGVQKYWNVLGYEVLTNKAGAVIFGGGLGYFIAAEISMFIAQCINFPLQRNITFRSHGNVWWQLMWYFIGWVIVSLFVNAINSLWLPLAAAYLPPAVYNIFFTIAMGGISMVIFFFIFLIIFPDYRAVEKRAIKKLEKLKKKNAPLEKIKIAENKIADASFKANFSDLEKAQHKAITQANSKALAYFATVKNHEIAKEKVAVLEKSLKGSKDAKTEKNTSKIETEKAKVVKFKELIVVRKTAASKAIGEKENAIKEFDEIKRIKKTNELQVA